MNQFRLQMRLLFAAQFFAIGTYLPFMPVWLAGRGFTASQIALVLTLPLAARILLAPLMAYAVDRFGHRQRALTVAALAAGLGAAALLAADTFWPVVLVFVFLAVFWSVLMPFSEALALAGARSYGVDYGRVRLWGSVSFIAANLGAGWLVGAFSAGAALVTIAVSFLVTGAVAAAMRDPAADTAAAPPPGLAAPAGLRLLLRWDFAVAVLVAGVLQSSHALFYSFGTLHWQGQGLSTTLIGILWAVGVIAEVVLFAFAPAVLARVGIRRMLLAAAAAACLRWALMALDPPLWSLFGLQSLHAFTFGATHLATMQFVARAIPDRFGGTAQSLLYGVSSLIMAMTTLASGPLYGAVGGSAYWAMAAMGALILATLLAFRRIGVVQRAA